MRTPNLGSASYTVGKIPDDPNALQRFLADELPRIAFAIQLLAAGHIDKTYAAPSKPREGDIRLADGTTWNPGSGAGFYGYRGGAWHLLG